MALVFWGSQGSLWSLLEGYFLVDIRGLIWVHMVQGS